MRERTHVILITEVVVGLDDVPVDAAVSGRAGRVAVVALKHTEGRVELSGVAAVDVPSLKKGSASTRGLWRHPLEKSGQRRCARKRCHGDVTYEH